MIIKVKKHTGEFFQMYNAAIQEPGLSWAAKGLLSYFLSLPETWNVRISELYGRGKFGPRSTSGKKATEAAMQELIDAGYVVKQGYGGGTIYTVYEDKSMSAKGTQRTRSMSAKGTQIMSAKGTTSNTQE